MKPLVIAVVLAPLLASGCVAPVTDPGTPGLGCGAGELQDLVGRPGEVLNGMRFSQSVRVLEYGMAVTMDFDPARLNIHLDQWGFIDRVNCG